jgi:hypothetical protein
MKKLILLPLFVFVLWYANAQNPIDLTLARAEFKTESKAQNHSFREEVQLFGYVTLVNALAWNGFKGALITLNLRDNPKESVIIFLDESHYMQTVFETGLQTTFLVTVNCTETDRDLPTGGSTSYKKYDQVRSVQLFNRR